MVRREVDGSTLYFIGSDDVVVRVTRQDSQYGVVQATQDLQISARLQNNLKRKNYEDEVANKQISVDAFRPFGEVPVKPLHLVVSDPTINEYGEVMAGTQSEDTNWVPPLKELVFKK